MPSLDTSFGTVDYRVAGPDDPSARTVVFVHGLLVDNALWRPAADALAERGVRSVAPVLPLGSHRTALHSNATVGPRDVARLLLEFLAALDLTDVTLVGNDTGGAICQFLIDTDASRIGRLVLTNCDAFDTFPPAPFGLLVAAARRPGRTKVLARLVRPRPLRDSPLGFGVLMREKHSELTGQWLAAALESADVRRDLAKFVREVRPADLLDVSTRLDRFAKPVLLLWGEADRFFRISLAHRLAERFPDARLVAVPRAGTFVALDEPERVADEIAAFHIER